MFPKLDDKSIDCVIVDLPYGTTKCAWDTRIDLCAAKMWEELDRVCTDKCNLIFFCDFNFGVKLVNSNPKMFRYDIVWEKSRATGFLNSKRQPMRAHETLLVFYKSSGARYNVIKTEGEAYVHGNRPIIQGIYGNVGECSGTYIGRFPRSVKLVQNSGRTRHPFYLMKNQSNYWIGSSRVIRTRMY
jgi:site-specific DNA-methyltransferase (adenine-specific)